MRRLFTFISGRIAERAAFRFLRRQGLRAIERNVQIGRDEIDGVFVDQDTVVFVEVRYRRLGIAEAFDSIDHKKAQSMLRAARHYRAREGLKRTKVRIDVIAVSKIAGEWTFAHRPAALSIEPPIDADE